jgi:hypothetical protein
MIFNRSAEWLIPFVVRSSKFVKGMKNVESLTLCRPPIGIVKPFHGITYYSYWDKKYSIVIYTHGTLIKRKNPLELKYEPHSVIETLECLAHELAHIDHFNHTPKHKILECKIKTALMVELDSLGYSSDEDNKNLVEFLVK